MTADMSALIQRIEQAEGPCRELDFAIFRTLHPEYAGPEWQPYASGLRHINDGSDARCLPPPEATPEYYTSSLDAATSLVPKGWRIDQIGEWEAPCLVAKGPWLAILLPRDRPRDFFCKTRCDHAATPALALVAAALKAMEARDAE